MMQMLTKKNVFKNSHFKKSPPNKDFEIRGGNKIVFYL